MYYSKSIIEKIGTDKELAVRLDKAFIGVKDGVADYLNNLGDATTRLLYYTSCFTKNYQDVCKRLSIEDGRFLLSVYELITHRDIIFRMLKIYVETILKHKNKSDLKIIYEQVVPVTTHYSVMQISRFALVYSIVKYICYGNTMNATVQSAFMKKIAGRTTSGLLVLSTYGMVQHAAESANNLKHYLPQFYHALYIENLEMMYFLIEPTIMKAGYLNIGTASTGDIIKSLRKMAGK